jgi:hypothetical protein
VHLALRLCRIVPTSSLRRLCCLFPARPTDGLRHRVLHGVSRTSTHLGGFGDPLPRPFAPSRRGRGRLAWCLQRLPCRFGRCLCLSGEPSPAWGWLCG